MKPTFPNHQNPLALVTGVGKRTGIGFGLCRELGLSGYTVLVSAKTQTQADAMSQFLQHDGHSAVALELDVASSASVAKAAAFVTQTFGRLDVLINNAAVLGSATDTLQSMPLHQAAHTFNLNLFGPWRTFQSFLSLLAQSPQGRIVNVSSGAGSHHDPVFGLTSANPVPVDYALSKAALNALTALMAKTAASPTMVISAVCPGFTATFPDAELLGARPVSAAVASIMHAVRLPNGSPSGTFTRDGQPLPW